MQGTRISFQDLPEADLFVDAVYEGGRSGNAGDDPLHPLLGVSIQGGFRYLGALDGTLKLIVLVSSFADVDWPDRLDPHAGLLTYFGDNKEPGRELETTRRNGNLLLARIFGHLHCSPPQREQIPPILIFGKAGTYRDLAFRGLAVPGASHLDAVDDLVAVWKTSRGQRYQNYKAVFTILDAPQISRDWLASIVGGEPLDELAPEAWLRWVKTGKYHPLIASKSVDWRTKSEQLPDSAPGRRMLAELHRYFQRNPFLFEKCALSIAQHAVSQIVPHTCEITPPRRDGGRDVLGKYQIGTGESSIYVDFALEAKCYQPDSGVGVKDVSRLISRLRTRQFGIFVTTSYVAKQAYQEIVEDGHPIVVISGKDIFDVLVQKGLRTLDDLKQWLDMEFPMPEPG